PSWSNQATHRQPLGRSATFFPKSHPIPRLTEHHRSMAPPPELNDDAVTEIILRLPPDDPACLFRAALVCKPWRRILTDPAFSRRYREFHRTPPLLGFLRNRQELDPRPQFVPTADASPFSSPAFDCGQWWALDCRHGRLLFRCVDRLLPMGLVVWNPITGDKHYFPHPESADLYDAAAVLCAADGCDHMDCHGGPFRVVLVGEDCNNKIVTRVNVYSSEIRAWSNKEVCHCHFILCDMNLAPCLLDGDALCFMGSIFGLSRLVKYDLGEEDLSVINLPKEYDGCSRYAYVMTAVGGVLGLASVDHNSLHLWSWQAGANGADDWVHRAIDLKTLLPANALSTSPKLIGYAEGSNTIFMNTSAGAFAMELNSKKVRKIGKKGGYSSILPYMSFYTPVTRLRIMLRDKGQSVSSHTETNCVRVAAEPDRGGRTKPTSSQPASLDHSFLLLPCFTPLSPTSPNPHPNPSLTTMATAPPRPPPELIDDAVAQILLRLPPDNPACLVRAALVCKPWYRILSDPDFPRRYRAFHRAPPLLGFITNISDTRDDAKFVPSFTAVPFSPPLFCRHDSWVALDCRHGRVLLHSYRKTNLVVWDPVTGDERHLEAPLHPGAWVNFTAALLCAADGCEHLNCHGGPFLVVFVSTDYVHSVIWASVYSSETRNWSAPTSLQHRGFIDMRPSLIVGDTLCFSLMKGNYILKYDLAVRGLELHPLPGVYKDRKSILMTAEDGGLGFVGLDDCYLELWSFDQSVFRGGCVESRVIDLKKLLPVVNPMISSYLIGFAEGTDIIFLSAHVDAFMIELKSGKVRKVDLAEGRFPAS
ncbi:hypothetical protein EJB05_14195, partial [Eragrostis curvula]